MRDALMKRKVEDYDVATDAKPEVVLKLFKKVIPTGIKHGTVTVLFKNLKIEVTTFRIEYNYSDSRHPEIVEFVPSVYEDLKRRDFTINSIAYDLSANKIIDPNNGKADIKNKLIRAIGVPENRFKEDGLRLLRACRFSAQLNFKIETNTKLAIKKYVSIISNISMERIREEILRILKADKPSIGFNCMHETGLLSRIIPELEEGIGVTQRGLHCFDVFFHSLFSCDAAPKEDPVVRTAALFHDVGKPRALFYTNEGEARFHGHEELSFRMAKEILKRLKFPNAFIERAAYLVKNHMFNYTDDWTDAAVRRFIARVGREYIDDLISLRRADQIGTCNKYFISNNLIEFMKRIKKIESKGKAFTVKDLAVDGHDIMKNLKIQEGYKIGLILNYLLEAVIDNPEINTKESLIKIAGNYYRQRLKNEL